MKTEIPWMVIVTLFLVALAVWTSCLRDQLDEQETAIRHLQSVILEIQEADQAKETTND